jgi:hypothetical protein
MKLNRDTFLQLIEVAEMSYLKGLIRVIEADNEKSTYNSVVMLRKEDLKEYVKSLINEEDVIELNSNFEFVAVHDYRDELIKYNEMVAKANRIQFQEHKALVIGAIQKRGFLTRLLYLINPKHCLTCK